MSTELLQATTTYGLGVVLSVGMAVFLGWMLKYILRENSKREERLAGIIERDIANLTLAANTLSEKLTNTKERNDEISRRNREEHENFAKRQAELADAVQLILVKAEIKTR